MNNTFPGLPDYVGPAKGWFTLLHHGGPQYEESDNVMERIDFIKAYKPKNEVATRLRHIVFVSVDMPPAWLAYATAATQALGEQVLGPALDVLDAEIAALIPDCKWNGKTIVFPEAS